MIKRIGIIGSDGDPLVAMLPSGEVPRKPD